MPLQALYGEVADALDMPGRHVKLLGQAVVANAVQQPAFKNGPVAL